MIKFGGAVKGGGGCYMMPILSNMIVYQIRPTAGSGYERQFAIVAIDDSASEQLLMLFMTEQEAKASLASLMPARAARGPALAALTRNFRGRP